MFCRASLGIGEHSRPRAAFPQAQPSPGLAAGPWRLPGEPGTHHGGLAPAAGGWRPLRGWLAQDRDKSLLCEVSTARLRPACAYMYVHAHTSTHMHEPMHTRARTCMYTCIFVHIHTRACTYTHAYTCSHKCTHMRKHAHIHAHTHAHMHTDSHMHVAQAHVHCTHAPTCTHVPPHTPPHTARASAATRPRAQGDAPRWAAERGGAFGAGQPQGPSPPGSRPLLAAPRRARAPLGSRPTPEPRQLRGIAAANC